MVNNIKRLGLSFDLVLVIVMVNCGEFLHTLSVIVTVNCGELLHTPSVIVTVNCSEFLKHTLSNCDGELL